MKKFLIAAFVSLIPSFLLADTQTTGNMKLLQPTTGYVDPTGRSWADKLNKNFSIIDATMTAVQNQLNNTAASTATLAAGFAASTGALAAGISASSGAYGAGVTASSQAFAAYVNLVFSTASTRSDGISNSTTTNFSNLYSTVTSLNTRLNNGATTLYDNSVLRGNFTTINLGTGLSATTSGSTATINGSAASGPSSRSYTIVVGTSNNVGADMIAIDELGLNMAIASATKMMTNAPTIKILPGVYNLKDCVTVSSNVTVDADNGALFTNTNSGQENVLRIKGRWRGGTFKASNLRTNTTCFILIESPTGLMQYGTIINSTNTSDVTSALVQLDGTGPGFEDNLVINNAITGGSGRHMIISQATAGARINRNKFLNNSGGNGLVLVASTSPYEFVQNTIQGNTGSMNAALQIQRSSGSTIAFNTFDMTAAAAITPVYMQTQGDGTNCSFVNINSNVMKGCTLGVVIQTHDTAVYATNVVISNNVVISPGTAAFKIYRNATGSAVNTFFHGNTVVNGTTYSEDGGSVNTFKADMVNNAVETP